MTVAKARPDLPKLRAAFRIGLEWIVIVLAVALAAVVVLGVGFRKAGASLVWYDEAASILLAWLTYYGAALAFLRRGHIGVPTLVERLRGRARTGAVLLAEGATALFFVILAWAGWQVQVSLAGDTLVSMPRVPAALAQSVIPVGAVLCLAAQALSLPEALAGAGGPEGEGRET